MKIILLPGLDGTGFISSPSILSKLVDVLPIRLMTPNYLSKRILYLFGFSLTGGSELVSPVFSSLQKADICKLKARLHNIANLDKPDQTVACPVTYIRPRRDFLVSLNAVKYLSSKCSNFTQVRVNGGHFIAQSNPVACAKVIYNAVNT